MNVGFCGDFFLEVVAGGYKVGIISRGSNFQGLVETITKFKDIGCPHLYHCYCSVYAMWVMSGFFVITFQTTRVFGLSSFSFSSRSLHTACTDRV